MKREVVSVHGEGKVRVKIQHDKYGTDLLTTRNGYQWSGFPIDREMAKQIIMAMSEYLNSDVDR